MIRQQLIIIIQKNGIPAPRGVQQSIGRRASPQKFTRLQPYLDKELGFSLAYNASLPMSILFDSTGKEVWRSTGGMDWTSAVAKAALAEAK